MILLGNVVSPARETANGIKVKVDIPDFKSPGGEPVIIDCNICVQPGEVATYKVGDVVYVSFVQETIDYAFILGKVYKGVEDSKSSATNYNILNSLEVTDTVRLPENTLIGKTSLYDLKKNQSVMQDDIETLKHNRTGVSSENAGTGIDITTSGILHNLPAEYKEVQYLQGTGTQYIDTGYKLTSQKEKIETKMKVSPSTTNLSFFGGNGGSNYSLLIWVTGGNFITYVGASTVTSLTSADVNTIYDLSIVANNGNFYSKVNDHEVTSTYGGSLDTTQNIYIFGKNGGGSSVERSSGQTLYNFKLYDNDVLVRNYIPCYRIADSVPGLYDLVTNTFYDNDGTGSFIVGPDVTNVVKINTYIPTIKFTTDQIIASPTSVDSATSFTLSTTDAQRLILANEAFGTIKVDLSAFGSAVPIPYVWIKRNVIQTVGGKTLIQFAFDNAGFWYDYATTLGIVIMNKIGNGAAIYESTTTKYLFISYENAEVDNLFRYSNSNEIQVGRWIDGKIIYKKSFELTGINLSTGDTTIISDTGFDGNKVIKYEGVIYYGNASHSLTGWHSPEDTGLTFQGRKCQLYCDRTWNSIGVRLTVYYTKT